MATIAEFSQLAQACLTIGNESAERTGFVPLHRLLARFQAQLIFRPLLVEGMLVKLQQRPGEQSWAVLVDKEQHPFTAEDVQRESDNRPLPARLRNTVAHELAHSLAFRASEFGVQLRGLTAAGGSESALVERIEQETERLSPLLLCPESALIKLVQKEGQVLTADALRHECRRLGISRQLLINRLSLIGLGTDKGPTYYKGLRNIGIGVGEWAAGGKATFRNWPLFVNFDRNLLPAMFFEIRRQDRLPASSVFSDPDFVLGGGANLACQLDTAAGTSAVPNAGKMRISCEVETTNRRPGSSFLYTVHGELVADGDRT
jgi:hypothetical protein